MSNMQEQDADKTVKKVGHAFKSGAEWNGNRNGRPKGARNKLGEDFLHALRDDFNTHGVKAIEEVRTKRPHEYLKVIASILPKEMTVNTRSVEEMDDDELAAALAALRSLCFAADAREGAGTEALN